MLARKAKRSPKRKLENAYELDLMKLILRAQEPAFK